MGCFDGWGGGRFGECGGGERRESSGWCLRRPCTHRAGGAPRRPAPPPPPPRPPPRPQRRLLRPTPRPRQIRPPSSLFTPPGFAFRAIDLLLTNFHLPRSTLLMLVSAFAGRENVLAAYESAIAADYLFYSYGDAMLIV